MEKHSSKESVLSKLNNSSADEIAKSPMLSLFQKRWSPRAFSGNPIDRTIVTAVFDSSKHSASSFNEQPWRIILSENETDSYKNIFDAMSESNRLWAQSAPLFGVVISKRNFAKTGQ
jgi:nitroreductase